MTDDIDTEDLLRLLTLSTHPSPDWELITRELSRMMAGPREAVQMIGCLSSASASLLRSSGQVPERTGDGYFGFYVEGGTDSDQRAWQILTAILNGDRDIAVTLTIAGVNRGEDEAAELLLSALDAAAMILQTLPVP